MNACLSAAHAAGMASVAFPAIGTGVIGVPPAESACIMFEQVASFIDSNSPTTLNDVRFVIYEQDAATLKVNLHVMATRSGAGFVT